MRVSYEFRSVNEYLAGDHPDPHFPAAGSGEYDCSKQVEKSQTSAT